MVGSLSSAHSTRMPPARTSVSICASLPQEVALSRIQQASVRTPTSAVVSVHSARTRGRQPESSAAWICAGVPAATLLIVQHASFWISRAGCSISARSRFTRPSSTTTCVKSRSSSAHTMLPTARSAGLHTRVDSWFSRFTSLAAVAGSTLHRCVVAASASSPAATLSTSGAPPFHVAYSTCASRAASITAYSGAGTPRLAMNMLRSCGVQVPTASRAKSAGDRYASSARARRGSGSSLQVSAHSRQKMCSGGPSQMCDSAHDTCDSTSWSGQSRQALKTGSRRSSGSSGRGWPSHMDSSTQVDTRSTLLVYHGTGAVEVAAAAAAAAAAAVRPTGGAASGGAAAARAATAAAAVATASAAAGSISLAIARARMAAAEAGGGNTSPAAAAAAANPLPNGR